MMHIGFGVGLKYQYPLDFILSIFQEPDKFIYLWDNGDDVLWNDGSVIYTEEQ